MKNIIPFIIGGVLLVAGVIGITVLKNKTSDSPVELIQQQQANQKQTVSGIAESTVVIVTETPNAVVPLPTEEDIIRTFFVLIDEGKPSEAVMMMGKEVTGNDSYKQAWAVQFNAFKSAKLISLEAYDKTNPPAGEAGWTDRTHRYRIVINAEMKPESKDEVIPFFGWDNGENVRWVELVKENNLWKISGIATGQ